MRITNGSPAEVWRLLTPRDRLGDGEFEYVGTIQNSVFQWASAASVGLRFHPSTSFREVSDLSAVMFFPRDDPLKVQARDRIKFKGNFYQVVGDRAWDEVNPATGYDFGNYMVQVETVD